MVSLSTLNSSFTKIHHKGEEDIQIWKFKGSKDFIFCKLHTFLISDEKLDFSLR